MKKTTILLLLVILLAIIACGILVLSLDHHSTVVTQPSSTSFPVGGENTNATSPSSGVVTFTGQASTTITTKDFINNGLTVPDVENKGNYLLAGSLGYCLPNMKCTAGSQTKFNIFYDSTEQFFTIALLTEPLGQSRKDAQSFLQNDLGLTEQQLCNLKYFVGTTYFVNESYAGNNLGFSFCSGATELP
jgi:hypothetical protein